VVLAVAVAFVPRRQAPRQVAALAAAILIAVELAMTHWFYLYVVWFLPLFMVAVFSAYRHEPEPPPAEREPEPAETAVPAVA
jgi:hypothetical protein